MTLRYLSVCSGIEAASVAWHGLGWHPIAFSEIDPFASSVLAQRFPNVPNLGDMERYRDWPIETGAVDVLVGGTPCQSFSVAGLRRGLDDPRGNLALVYLGLVDRFRPRYVVWENVPGVLSSNGGRDFGAFLAGLAQLGYGWAYRVLDAQWVRVDSHPRAVPQRRRRVFVVGCAGGNWRRAAEVLLEPEGVRGDPPTRGSSRQSPAGSSSGGARDGLPETVGALCADTHAGAYSGQDAYTGRLIPATQYVAVEPIAGSLGVRGTRLHTELDGHGAYVVEPLPFDTTQITHPENRSQPRAGDPCHPLVRAGHPPAVAFAWPVDVADPVTANEGATYTHEGSRNFRMHNVVPAETVVRRLTPRECERLQGFPDDWTAITYRGKPASDGPRYKAIGNSMAVNVMRWIGARIAKREANA